MLTHWVLKCIVNARDNGCLNVHVVPHWHCVWMVSLVGHEGVAVGSWWEDHWISRCPVAIVVPCLLHVALHWRDGTVLRRSYGRFSQNVIDTKRRRGMLLPVTARIKRGRITSPLARLHVEEISNSMFSLRVE